MLVIFDQLSNTVMLFGNCTAEQALKLEHLQLDCIWIIMGLTKFCSNENLYRKSGFDTLSERRRQHRQVYDLQSRRTE